MTVFALTLAILALAMPLGASAADEKDDPRRDAPRREETPAAVVFDASAAPAPSNQLAIEESHPVCPPGFELAQPPLNPDLGCIATSVATATGSSGSGTVVVVTDTRHPEPECPPGWVLAESPLNEELGCINNTAAGGASSHGGDGSDPYPLPPLPGGDGSHHHPGHCQEGYVLKLLLKQNPDGSLTFFYGCVKDGGGIVTGPTDITSG